MSKDVGTLRFARLTNSPLKSVTVLLCMGLFSPSRHIFDKTNNPHPLSSRTTEYFRACQQGISGSEKRAKKKRERRPLF
jgi:hypothetical protein